MVGTGRKEWGFEELFMEQGLLIYCPVSMARSILSHSNPEDFFL